MRSARIFIAACLTVATAFGSAHAAGDVEAFARSVASRAFAITGSETAPSVDRRQRFLELIGETFDTDRAGPSLLGSYWLRAASWERQAFRRAFDTAVASVYMDRLYLYPGQTFAIDGHRDEGDDVVVQSRLTSTRGRPDVLVEWVVAQRDGDFTITDMVFNGESVNGALRREYLSVVRRNDGHLSALVDSMTRQQALLMEAEC